jgi:hypothetical protein
VFFYGDQDKMVERRFSALSLIFMNLKQNLRYVVLGKGKGGQ